MAVLQMQKIHICALNTDRKQILESLQRKGIVQINADQDTDIFHCTDTSAGCAKYEKFSHMADQALKILDTYAPEKKGLLTHALAGFGRAHELYRHIHHTCFHRHTSCGIQSGAGHADAGQRSAGAGCMFRGNHQRRHRPDLHFRRLSHGPGRAA